MIVGLLLSLALAAPVNEAFLSDLEKIKAANVTLKSEQQKWQSLQTSLFSKRMAWTPNLSVGVGKTSVPTSTTTTVETDYWRADASLNLWSGGSDLHELKSADLNVEAQSLRQVAQELKIESQAADLIFRTLYSEDVIKSTRELVKLREESHRIVSEKYKQGKVPLQEVSKSEIDKAQQENRLRNLEAEGLEIQSQWKALLREGVKTNLWPFDAEFKLPTPASELSPATLRLEKLARAAQEDHRAQSGKHWGTLDLTAAYQVYPLQAQTTKQWTTGILLTVPLWSRYETQAAIGSAYSSFVAAQGEYDQAVQAEQAQREVLQKRIELYRQSLTAAKRNVEKAKTLYADMVKSFRYGRMSVNDLLLEQNRLIESELGLSQSQLSFHKVIIESCQLVGRPLKSCLN